MVGFVRKFLLLLRVTPFTFVSTILLSSTTTNNNNNNGRDRWRNYITGQIALEEEVILFPTMARFIIIGGGGGGDNNNTNSNSINSSINHSINSNLTLTNGEWDDGGAWTIPIHGWIFEPERRSKKRRAFLKLLGNALKLNNKNNNNDDNDDNDNNNNIHTNSKEEQQRAVLTRRVQPFLVDNKRWKSPPLRIGSYGSSGNGTTATIPHTLTRRSGKNGHFYGTMTLSNSDLAAITNNNNHNDHSNNNITNNGYLSIEALTPPSPEDGRIFRGVIHLIPPTGLSIISDIDDTIKISHVTNKRRLLRNTFLEEFQDVPGMAQLYQNWQLLYNATFHFVSSSPYQLYQELEDFRHRVGFPPATYHLKTIRPKDATNTMVQLVWTDPFTTKTNTIASILQQFPNRTFVLVGDSGEKDPEVYGHVARLYPPQIVQILIRRVAVGVGVGQVGEAKVAATATAEAAQAKDDADQAFQRRMATAFVNVSSSRWRLFDDASELLQLVLLPPPPQ